MTTLLLDARRKARRYLPELVLVAAFSLGGLIASVFIALGAWPDGPVPFGP